MPYIRVDLEVRADPRWLDAPDAIRAKAKALYLDALSYSGELLTDGHVSTSVANGLATELGLVRARPVFAFLLSSGHLARTKAGFYLPEWERFHDSRETVQRRRTEAAKRQRSRRGQMQLGMSRRDMERDVTDMSQRDNGRDSRARERTQASAAEETKDLPKAVDLHHDEPELADTDPDDEPDIGGAPSTNGTARDFNIEQIKPTLREMPL